MSWKQWWRIEELKMYRTVLSKRRRLFWGSLVRATKGWQRNQASMFVFKRRNIVMGVQNLASFHDGTSASSVAVFDFSRKAQWRRSTIGSKAPKTENQKIRALMTEKIFLWAPTWLKTSAPRLSVRIKIHRLGIPQFADNKTLATWALWDPTHTRKYKAATELWNC